MTWLCLCALLLPPVQGPRVSDVERLLVPGGTTRLLQAAGIRVPVERDRAFLWVIRALYLTRSITPEAGPIGAVNSHLMKEARARAGGDRVPLLLPKATWENVVFNRKVDAAELAARILADRKAALLYYGLFSLDDETLGFFVEHPRLVSSVYRRSAGVFAAFADAVKVHDGRVELPGGTASADRWEALVEAPAADPEAFIAKLFARDGGRLAWLFDTIGRLDRGRQAFALGRDRDSLRSLYSAFAGFDDGWTIEEAPFTRYAPFDASMILQTIAATPDGNVAGRHEERDWRPIFSGPRVFSGAATTPITPAWLIDRFKGTPVRVRGAQLDAALFAQRLFAAAAGGQSAIDSASVAETLSNFAEREALIVTLERMGFTDSREYQQAVRGAAALTRRGDPFQQSLRLAMFQGAIALVERMHMAGALRAEAAREICLSLFPLATAEVTQFPQDMARWIETSLLPALPPAPADNPSSAEGRLVEALAGVSAERPGPVIEWEGSRYRVDAAAGELARLRRILRKLGGNDLDGALALGRVIGAITAASSSSGEVRAQAEKLVEMLPPLLGSAPPSLFGFETAGAREALLAAARQLASAPSDRISADDRRSLAGGLAIVLADVLASRAYAAAIGDPDAALLLGENPAHRHDFALQAAPPGGPWSVAAVMQVGTRSVASGSLLALERGLACFWLRPTQLTPPAARPLLWEHEVQGLAESVTAFNPLKLTDESRDAIAAALRRGRQRLAEARSRPDAIDRLAVEAGVEGWRRRLLRLAAASDPAAAEEYFSLGEMLALGLSGSEVPGLDAWGVSTRPIDGSLRQRLPLRLEWGAMAGYPRHDFLSTRVADVQLRVAEWLADMKLPASLAPGVMAYAMWDVTMSAQMADRDDWIPVFRAARRLSSDRLADYVAALTAGGPLVPVAR